METKFKVGDRVKVTAAADERYHLLRSEHHGSNGTVKEAGIILGREGRPCVRVLFDSCTAAYSGRNGLCWYEDSLELVERSRNRRIKELLDELGELLGV